MTVPTRTSLEKKLYAFSDANGLALSRSRVQALAKKIHWLALHNMPADTPTLATFERQARDYAARESIACTRADIRRLAKKFQRNWRGGDSVESAFLTVLEVERLMMPGTYAGANHRKTAARHTSGGRP